MESKLKALKVADLKEVLTKAGEKPAAKATKADLVAKILATPAALDAFTKEHGGAGASTAEQVPAAVAEPAQPAPAEPAAASEPHPEAAAATTDTPETAAASLDEEAEKRKKRAERFGIAFVENPVAPDSKRPRRGKAAAAGAAAKAPEEVEKLKTRAERFGTSQPEAAAAPPPAGKGNKRKSPAPVDPEEEEKRRKRAERFGLPVVGAKAA